VLAAVWSLLYRIHSALEGILDTSAYVALLASAGVVGAGVVCSVRLYTAAGGVVEGCGQLL
jgi:hypothetical protein